jgi:hypothetical protein
LPEPAIVQPIAYNHKVHIDSGLTCDFCHKGLVNGSPLAGRPTLSTCKNCHNPGSPLKGSAAEKQLLSYISKDQEPPWVRIHRLPDDVYFSHNRHVTLAGLDCKVCHGDMGKRTTPPPRPEVSLKMDWCLNCHRRQQASNDCNSCHK